MIFVSKFSKIVANFGVYIMRKANILIIEDNDLMLNIIKSTLEKCEDISIVDCANNGIDGMDKIAKHNPDIVILDLIMPGNDGFTVMSKVRKNNATCKFLVISSLNQDMFVTKAFNEGASYYIMKPFDANILVERIHDILKIKSSNTDLEADVNCNDKNGHVNELLTTYLISLGIHSNIKGYQYLKDAIKLAINQPTIITKITKDLYPTVAKENNSSSSKVERAIRNAIEIAWTKGKVENINSLFGMNLYSKYEKPTNGEFIALMADKIMLELA